MIWNDFVFLPSSCYPIHHQSTASICLLSKTKDFGLEFVHMPKSPGWVRMTCQVANGYLMTQECCLYFVHIPSACANSLWQLKHPEGSVATLNWLRMIWNIKMLVCCTQLVVIFFLDAIIYADDNGYFLQRLWTNQRTGHTHMNFLMPTFGILYDLSLTGSRLVVPRTGLS